MWAAGARSTKERQSGAALDGWMGHQAKMKEGEMNSFAILFSEMIFKIHFQKNLNSFSVLVRTNHHKNKYAAA